MGGLKKLGWLGAAILVSVVFAVSAFAAEPVVTVSPANVDLGEVAVGQTQTLAVDLTFTPKDLTEEVTIELAPGAVTEGWNVEAAGSVTLKPGDAAQTLKLEIKATATDKAKENLNAQVNFVVKKGNAKVDPAGLTVTATLKK